MAHAAALRLSLCLALGATACSLDVANPNAPDAARAIQSPGTAEVLIADSYNTWFNSVYSYNGPGMFLSNQAFQHATPWANSGMEFYGRLPREVIANDPTHPCYLNVAFVWSESYRAIAAAADGLRALGKPELAAQLSAADLTRDRAFGYFVLGLGHATIALLYDQGFVIDENTEVEREQPIKPYGAVMAAAMSYFDKALTLTEDAGFTLPTRWVPTDAALDAPGFAQLIHSMKARYLVEVARTPAERAAVDWRSVVAEIDAGITASFIEDMDRNKGWYYEANHYATVPGWSELPYFVWGMADQSGNYQLWLGAPLVNRRPDIGGRDLVIVTPDLRLPQGSTLAEQIAHKGKYLVVYAQDEYGYDPKGLWVREDRGTWRWSFYLYVRRYAYNTATDWHMEEIPISEMNLLKAEALYRLGDRASAAALVNISRVGIGGLNPTDAAGANTSCVPKLPDGRCGDLFEMIKWEKRVEGAFQGLVTAPWFFDSRGWGDLYKGTPLHFPVPCVELQVLNMLPCYTFGGSSYPHAAPGSTYRYSGEV